MLSICRLQHVEIITVTVTLNIIKDINAMVIVNWQHYPARKGPVRKLLQSTLFAFQTFKFPNQVDPTKQNSKNLASARFKKLNLNLKTRRSMATEPHAPHSLSAKYTLGSVKDISTLSHYLRGFSPSFSRKPNRKN